MRQQLLGPPSFEVRRYVYKRPPLLLQEAQREPLKMHAENIRQLSEIMAPAAGASSTLRVS
eukprot:2889938-Alexandrium_andersonii.AAC.1